MGCINSKSDINDINSNLFCVSNTDCEGAVSWSGQLEISRTELTLFRKGKKPAKWPLQCLRRYGYDADMFTFEAGRRCDTGPGIYAFRCRRAETLFHMLQNYIQGRAYSTDENINNDTTTSNLTMTSANLSSSLATHRNSMILQQQQLQHQQQQHTINIARLGNDCISNSINRVGGVSSGAGATTSQSLSPNGTNHSTSNQSRSSDTLTNEGNYLEPNPLVNRQQPLPPSMTTRFTGGVRLSSVSSGPLSPDINSPGSPSSITNILEVTQLNPLPANNHHCVSNLYQEFPINNNNNQNNNSNTICKKLSLDIPPLEPAPVRGHQSTAAAQIKNDEKNNIVTTTTTKTESPVKFINTPLQGVTVTAHQAIPMSPNGYDPTHSYMNINLGDLAGASSSNKSGRGQDSPLITSTPTSSKTFGFSMQAMYGASGSASIDATRCYENLDPGDMRPLFFKNHHHQRYSKPDIFTKVDLPLNHSNSSDKSEPCTPTANNQQQLALAASSDCKVNYIILDLNEVPNMAANIKSMTSNSLMNNNVGLSGGGGNINVGGNSSGAGCDLTIRQNSLLPPESPKNASIGYATIDFNKTNALSNSTTPSSELDSEGSRKTRHSSTIVPAARHSNSVSSD